MALIKNITLKNGLTVENVYIKIQTLYGSKSGLDITINSYISSEALKSGYEPLEQDSEHFVPSVEENSSNFIKQGYEYLKTLPKFANAIDC